MTIEYVFVVNNIYNSTRVKPVKWWNRLIGFSGQTVMARMTLNANTHTHETYLIAKNEFAEHGMYEQIMNVRY